MNLRKRIAPTLLSELDDPSPTERAAALEAQRVVARASGRLPTDPNLEPMPFFSWQSLREVLTVGGHFTLIRYDDDGNPNVGAAFYVVFSLAMGLLTRC